jgi:pilus assembly protein CpaB
VVLNPGMRAMSIPVSVESAAGGFILPGDRVDVVLSRQIQVGSNSEFRSETVMRNVKVLAIDQTTKPEDGAQSVVGATATLEVGSDDSEALALADAQGDLALVLRSYADVGGLRARPRGPS